jgi:hypothetical protein
MVKVYLFIIIFRITQKMKSLFVFTEQSHQISLFGSRTAKSAGSGGVFHSG